MTALPYRPQIELTPRESSQSWRPALAAAILGLAVYAVTLGGTFVYDDKILDIDIRYATPHYWYLFWVDQYWPHGFDNLYRPLTCMTFAVQKWLHGDLAWPYHAVNWLLHGANSAMVALLAARLSNRRAAWVAGMLFAAHPIHVEAVAGIVGRLEEMCTFPVLLAMYLFLRPMTAARAVALVGCFLWAVFSKEQGMLLPLILAGMIPCRRQMFASEAFSDRKYVRGLFVALSWVLAAYLIFRESILRFWWPRWLLYWTGNPLVLSHGLDRVLMPFVLLGRYVTLLIAPVHLSVDYGSMVIGWQVRYHEPYIYIGLAATLVALVVLFWAIQRRRWETVALWIALALTYGLVSNSVSLIGTIFAERVMYLPSAFFLILVGIFASRLRSAALAPLVVILALAASWHTFTNARLWNDPLALFTEQLKHHPRSLKLYDLVREQYAHRGDAKSEQRIGHACIENLPDVFEAYMLCADTALTAGDFDDAQRVAAEGYRKFGNIEMRAWVNKVAEVRRERAATQPATQASARFLRTRS